MSFVKLPRVPLVTNEEVDRLRQKFLETESLADADAFWKAIQSQKRPRRMIQENEDTFLVPAFVSEYPIG